MRIATIIVVVLALVLGTVALSFSIDSYQSESSSSNSTSANITSSKDNKRILAELSSDSLEFYSLNLVETVEDGIYRLNDYSKFYRVSSDGFEEIEDVKTHDVKVEISGETCELEIRYVEVDGKVIGGGEYDRVLGQQGIYSTRISLNYTLVEMPDALSDKASEEDEDNEDVQEYKTDEKLLAVRFSADDYYSEAFAVKLDGKSSRNLFSQSGREKNNSEGFVIFTDEQIRGAGEYFYFFSSRLYDSEDMGSSFNEYDYVDLFCVKGGKEELVAKSVHHNYVSDLGDGNICFIRTDYATLNYTMGSIPVTSFQEGKFKVIHLNLETMEETQVMQSDDPYTSTFRRFDDWLVRMSDEHYGTLEAYNMATNENKSYKDMGIRSVLGFDVSDDGRYIAVGGAVASVSTVNQMLHFIDTQSGETVSINGKEMFLTFDGNFKIIDDGYFINSNYNNTKTKFNFYMTEVSKIIETFKEGAGG